ncbi:MAG: bifunctional DNA-formamidopyrimidine glycosylase/DNA-(apurinic or apyrimidinic site) lyase [Pseudomonadota bacterium]
MPELPEVETTRRALAPHLVERAFSRIDIWQPRLRWPVTDGLEQSLRRVRIESIDRRAKYLLLRTSRGTVIVHLGMSGSLRLCEGDPPPHAHDRVGWILDNGTALRLRDPRRFGAVLWTDAPPEDHWLLKRLGPEPLSDRFDGDHLYRRSLGRRIAIKAFVMDSHTVAGVGNIYAAEALFRAGIHPARAAGRVSRARYARLATAVREVLTEAIAAGGTTLRDYASASGELGAFRFKLKAYGRDGEACVECQEPLRGKVIGGRSTVYCARCQR